VIGVHGDENWGRTVTPKCLFEWEKCLLLSGLVRLKVLRTSRAAGQSKMAGKAEAAAVRNL
jgi:hypothetical protein